MSCKQYQSNIEAFADGELDPQEHIQAAEHFDSCSDCQARIAQIVQMKKSLLRVLEKNKSTFCIA